MYMTEVGYITKVGGKTLDIAISISREYKKETNKDIEKGQLFLMKGEFMNGQSVQIKKEATFKSLI